MSFVVALAWLAERALGIDTALLELVDRTFRHGPLLIAGLALLALIAWRVERSPRWPRGSSATAAPDP